MPQGQEISCAISPVFGNMRTVRSTRGDAIVPEESEGADAIEHGEIRNRLTVGKGVKHEKDKPRRVGVVTYNDFLTAGAGRRTV